VAYEAGQPEEAYRLSLESLSIARDLKFSEGIAWILELIAINAALKSQPEQAVCLEAIYTRYREGMGLPQSPSQRQLLDGWLAPAHQALSDEVFQHAWDVGSRMPVDQALSKILEGVLVLDE
jgi:hypothetical protein